MGTKTNAFFGNFDKVFFWFLRSVFSLAFIGKNTGYFTDSMRNCRAQTESLKSPAVGPNRLVPIHKLVQTAHFAHRFVAGAQIEMVSIAKDRFGADFFELFHCQALDGGLSGNRNKSRRVNNAVFCLNNA